MKIGEYQLKGQVLLAPMAGITDLPFRRLCRKLGASLAVSEMVTSQEHLWKTRKTQTRLKHEGEPSPISVQIAGSDPVMMAKAAKFNVDLGADIIDINMGCPAKKVCQVQAGSALLKNEVLVREILHQVVKAVNVPVSLKIRTGWSKNNKNALTIAHIAEQEGIQAITIHGRTRECQYLGAAEYVMIKQVKQHISIPVIANGDIDSVEKAKFVLQYTGADAIMIGRCAQSQPWIFREINYFLQTDSKMPAPSLFEIRAWLTELVQEIYLLYGEEHGTKVARKHIKAFLACLPNANKIWQNIRQVTDAQTQLSLINHFFMNYK